MKQHTLSLTWVLPSYRPWEEIFTDIRKGLTCAQRRMFLRIVQDKGPDYTMLRRSHPTRLVVSNLEAKGLVLRETYHEDDGTAPWHRLSLTPKGADFSIWFSSRRGQGGLRL